MKFVFKFYRIVVSPIFHGITRLLSGNPYSGCKFEPTCSCYCEQAVQQYGFLKGGFKGFNRILRCHPFSNSGGYDPV